MSKWVSIDTRVPEGRVIIRYMRPILGVMQPHYEIGYFEPPDSVASERVGWLFWRDNKPVAWPVTHWAYLPSLIEEEETK